MKTIIISLLLIFTANAQNIWYVNANNTSGPWNGRSWATAWRYLDSSAWAGPNGINWAIIGSGDTIYVSGGADSTVYTPSLGANSSYGLWISPDVAKTVNGNPAVIAPAWHEGHNGKVVFATSSNSQTLLRIRNIANIKITGFTFRDLRGPYGSAVVMVGDKSNPSYNVSANIHIDNCTFIAKSQSTIIHFEVFNWTLSNCYLEHVLNDDPKDCDPITSFYGGGTILIENNTVIQRNTNIGTDAHRDMLQFGYFNEGSVVDIVIRNNLIAQIGQGSGWNAGIYNSISYRDTRWYIYNNIIVSQTAASSMGGIFVYNSESNKSENYWVFNNTIILNSPPSGNSMPISTGSNVNTDTVVYKNNLVITDAPVNYMFNVPAKYFGDYYRKIDYNGWFEYGGLSGNFMPGNAFGAWTYAQWRADDPENDAHSITGNSTSVTFQNKYGVAFEDYYTTTGRGLGVNMAVAHPELYAKFPDLVNDAFGNPRGNNWDMGAVQYQGGPSINFQGKIFLQGAFNGNLMSTQLADSCSCIPLQQPYNTAPWNYAGNESIVFPNGQPGSGYIDWVLVELRSSSNPVQVVGRRAAILRNDGRLLDTDGTTGVKFSNTSDGAYYVALFHRNHLAVMSANPVQLSANSQLYDFTNSMNKAYGNTPMAELGNGIFGMHSGDGDSNGGVTITDRNAVWQAQNGTVGYLKGDFNLNGGVNAQDANEFCTPNFGRMTQVP